jgi:hypothetical protein
MNVDIRGQHSQVSESQGREIEGSSAPRLFQTIVKNSVFGVSVKLAMRLHRRMDHNFSQSRSQFIA